MKPWIMQRSLAVQLLHAAQCSPEAEICGLVSAEAGAPARYWPVKNVAETPSHNFEMDAEQLIRAQQRIREAGHELWAIFHSHPSSPAEPSAKDLAETAYPQALRLIATLNTKGVLELRCWSLEQGQLDEQLLRIRD